jgi:hypothetical protein
VNLALEVNMAHLFGPAAPIFRVVHGELVARGANIRVPPTNFEWAFEMQVEDLDGNVLRLGSDPKEGVPYGDFLDAAGVRWPMSAAES